MASIYARARRAAMVNDSVAAEALKDEARFA